MESSSFPHGGTVVKVSYKLLLHIHRNRTYIKSWTESPKNSGWEEVDLLEGCTRFSVCVCVFF